MCFNKSTVKPSDAKFLLFFANISPLGSTLRIWTTNAVVIRRHFERKQCLTTLRIPLPNGPVDMIEQIFRWTWCNHQYFQWTRLTLILQLDLRGPFSSKIIDPPREKQGHFIQFVVFYIDAAVQSRSSSWLNRFHFIILVVVSHRATLMNSNIE